MANVADLFNKTNRYMKRNGIEKTAYAVADGAFTKTPKNYYYQVATNDELKAQRAWSGRFSNDLKFSLLVPAYETNSDFFAEMIDSVAAQTYTNWELVIADGSKSFRLKDELEKETGVITGDRPQGKIASAEELTSLFGDAVDAMVEYTYDNGTIKYIHLKTNGGISDNTNYALKLASGDYIGLLDHDDILTPDALYYMSKAIVSSEYRAKMIFSDEDKTDPKSKSFFEPNRKPDLNLDMILTNNYICHLTFFERELIKSLGFRGEYDGAQDYDLILRAILSMENPEAETIHIPKILYHWRAHEDSTAVNTDSKEYAYEAGRRAVDDYCKAKGWAVNVSHTAHLGFYHIEYRNFLFTTRPEIGILCGPLYKLGKISGGAMRADGTVMYRGLAKGLGGYLHRGSLVQEVEAADIRNMRINPVLENLYDEMVESKFAKNSPDYVKISLEFSAKVREMGYRIVYDPDHKKE